MNGTSHRIQPGNCIWLVARDSRTPPILAMLTLLDSSYHCDWHLGRLPRICFPAWTGIVVIPRGARIDADGGSCWWPDGGYSP